ncbi:MAG: sigma-70 family RNA polymerase sigma factor [Fimbriimonadaceae bacterium]|nr:sigma-70 family RNA polymerase sigma factor [Fimbriimonadaceae bacterium]
MLFRTGRDRLRDRFEREFKAVFPSLNGTALRLTRDSDDAADLVQEAAVRAFDAFERFDGQNFKAWMLRILTNLYINKYRQRQRTGNQPSLDEETMDEPVAALTEIPDQQILANLLEDEVEAALAAVPEIFRTAVVLSDIEGASYDEIAEMLEIPVGTVRSRIARGRAHLRGSLERFAIERGYLRQD